MCRTGRRGHHGDVERSFEVPDVLGGPPGWSDLLRRGRKRQCPRCGDPDVFEHRFRLRSRCAACGHRFVREPGFFLGAWFLNFMFISVLEWAAVMGWIIWRSAQQSAGLAWPLIVAGVAAIVVPILTYPWSLTLWAAIDLGMTPLELAEIVDAADAVEAADER